MKKRLLITSIVMMLVVAVALSTATYAWFTSNASVSASSISLTAAVSDEAALGIGWAGGDASTSISADVAGTLQPMAPLALSGSTLFGATGGSASNNIAFTTQTTKQENSVIVFNTTTPTGVDPVVFGNGTATSFYVKNLSPSNSISRITVSATFTGDGDTYTLTEDTTFNGEKTYYTKAGNAYSAATVTNGAAVDANTYYEKNTTANASLQANDMIRIAIFKKANSTGAGSGDFTLIGVLGQNATTYTVVSSAYDRNTTYYTRSGEEGSYVYTQATNLSAFADGTTYYTAANTAVYGTLTAGSAVKELSNYTVSDELVLTTNLAHGDQVDIVAVAWLDGTMLNDGRQNQVGNFSLTFDAE